MLTLRKSVSSQIRTRRFITTCELKRLQQSLQILMTRVINCTVTVEDGGIILALNIEIAG
jgi:hypothetical protein